ncbi:MAG: Holliday junction resolvase RuvX [Dysgonamonadaceae bacterium]|jgi:putative Holliday junction resolvase|nr:Holliday junction resolvase RuvX [Dysgonamonadaceae bacterium]
MGRILAIDYGKKRTGLAVSDPLQMIAGGLATVESRTTIDYLRQYTANEEVERFILGEPRRMNYEPSENMPRVEQFRRQLQKAIPSIPVQLVDERFTSVLAHRAMREGGLKKSQRQDKARVDELSATILLQTYLETIRK